MQCRGGTGACPDTVDTTTGRNCTNDVSDVSGFIQDGQQCISFTRPFTPGEVLFKIALIYYDTYWTLSMIFHIICLILYS